jgi:hypothetical protein
MVAVAMVASLTLLTVVLGGAAPASALLKLAGFVDVPPDGAGGTLTLPLAQGASPVTIHVTFGVPGVSIPVEITRTTQIEFDDGLPVTIGDGDRIRVEAVVNGGVIRAVKLEIDEFPDLELRGTASGLPAGGVNLPLAAGATVNFIVTLGSSDVDVPVRLTDKTRIRGGHFTLQNGDPVRVEAAVRNNAIVATEIRH